MHTAEFDGVQYWFLVQVLATGGAVTDALFAFNTRTHTHTHTHTRSHLLSRATSGEDACFINARRLSTITPHVHTCTRTQRGETHGVEAQSFTCTAQ